MNLRPAFFSLITLLSLSTTLQAAPVPEEVAQTISQRFQTALPSLNIDALQPSPIADIYQVTSGPVVMYVTQDGHYAITGDILDLSDGKTNITEVARKAARVSTLQSLDRKQIITYPAKEKKYAITVFTDLDCGYCRKFHADIENYNALGIEVNYLAFPRAGKQSTSFEKAVSVWCADDKQQAFTQAKQGQNVPANNCGEHNVEQHFKFGVMSGITGTPTIMLKDGTLVPGYLPPEHLIKLLKETQ
jgi:thiol:disulfide interchange protein DsbC